MCALALAEKDIRSTVFDTGRHGWGGASVPDTSTSPASTAAPAADGSHSAITVASGAAGAADTSRGRGNKLAAEAVAAVSEAFDHRSSVLHCRGPQV